MRKLLFLCILLFTCCAPTIKIATVTVGDNSKKVFKTYQDVQIVKQINQGDKILSIQFIERNGLQHYVDGGFIEVDHVEYIKQPKSVNYIVINPLL